MSKIRTFIAVVSPSILSGTVTLLLAGAFVAQKSWAYIHHKQLFYDFLFGNYGVNTRLLARSGSSSSFSQRVFNDSSLYLTLLVICALGVGCLVYLLIRSLSGLAQESRVVLYEIRSTNKAVKAMLAASTARFLLRLFGLVGWVVYAVLFMAVLVPASISLAEHGISGLSMTVSGSGWFYLAGATMLLAASLQVHVIFMRLCFLRLRLFGGLDSDLYLSDQ